MYKICLLCLIILFASCSDDTTDPNGMADVQLNSKFQNRLVVKLQPSGFTNENIDSLVLTDFRVLISSLKLGNGTKEESLKTNPYVIKSDSTGNLYMVSKATVPEGDYDKIKFEIHKFSESEREAYIGDTLFGDFATTEKNTIIISGYYYINGEATEFHFTSDQTENLSINFPESINLTSDNLNTLLLEINPTLIFQSDGIIIEPNSSTQKDIEKNIHKGIIALKK